MNRMMKKIIHFSFIGLLIGSMSNLLIASQEPISKEPIPQMPGFPEMSEEEMQVLETELNELSKLSPEEQENFFQAVMDEARESLSDDGKELFDRINAGEDISEEDFEKLFEELIPTPEKEKPVEKEVKPELKKEEKKPEPKPVITSKHETAIDRINSLITYTNQFIVKSGTVPELPGKIQRWEKKDKINWKSGLTWNGFKAELEKFVMQLNKLLEQDKKSKQFKHLDELLKNETLYNNLSKVEKSVSSLVPQIEEVPPLGAKMSKESKRAMQKSISEFIEALYKLTLPQELDKLFEICEPKAKEQREAEEAAQKKAAEEAKKPRIPGRPVIAGTPEQDTYFPPVSEPYSPAYDAGYEPSYDTYDAYNGAPSGLGTLPSADSKEPSRIGTPIGKPSDEEKTDSLKDKKEVATAKPETKDKKAKKTFTAKEPKDLKEAADKISDQLKDLSTTIENSKPLSNIDVLLKEDVNIGLVQPGGTISRLIGDSEKVVQLIQTMKNKIKSSKALKYYKTKLEKRYDKDAKEITRLVDQIQSAEKTKATLPIKQQYAYFGVDVMQSNEQAGFMERIEELAHHFSAQRGDALEEGIAAMAVDFPGFDAERVFQTMQNILEQEQIQIIVPSPAILTDLVKSLKEIKAAIGSFDKKK